ncbi:penicillin-binding protein [Allokutzneria sp. NRRL B-24872]|uniref:penicillin-binding protein n=1 Tax=Allokutzneria sp. NRRL B-24872 TaxID=1137961 RepID=UPI000A35D89F|nr:penicillin-binding protein [Allokutzneria sp. NRRL B-24872]
MRDRVSIRVSNKLDITDLTWDDEPVRHRKRPKLRLLALCVLTGVLLAAVLFPGVGALGMVAVRAGDTVDSTATELVAKDPPLLTTMQDTTGKPLAHLYDQYRVLVPAEKIAVTMKAAIVAIEDQRFYEHEGVDLVAIGRALVTNTLRGKVSQGGSTLTQQYVKNYLTHIAAETKLEQTKAREQSAARKLRELRTALQLERVLTKDEILGRYLNTVPFGQSSYGIAAAAQTYFGIAQEDLTVAQAALLAGIVNEPSGLNPYRFPERALARRNVVIDEMAKQHRLPAEMAEAEKKAPLGLAPETARPPNGCIGTGDAGYFCDYVTKYLESAGLSKDKLRRGGYTIKTTLDRDALTKAKTAVDGQVPPDTEHAANAMAIVKPGKDKHRVVALAANRAYGLDRDKHETTLGLPYAMQNLGAGSIYKIFTAAAALEKGMGINDSLPVPGSYTSNVFMGGAASCPMGAEGVRKYCVQNAGEYPERMSMQDALATSPNTTFVQLLEKTGVPATVDMAVRLGLRSLNTVRAGEDPKKRSIGKFFSEQNYGSFTLGPTPTSTLELANVGATLASGGTWCPPSPVEEVLDRHGRRVPLTEPPCAQVVEPGLANAMTVGLSKDALTGTARAAAKEYGWDRPMAGKTGTTQEHKSSGFLGYTPQLSAAVFTFDDSPSPTTLCDPGGSLPPRPCSGGRYIYGGKYPARTWFHAMNGAGEQPGIMTAMERVELPEVEDRYADGERERREPEVRERAPSVVGLSLAEARERLESAGFTVRVVQKASQRPKGTVIGQSGGGSVITVQVSTGVVAEAGSEAAAPGTTATTTKPKPRPTTEQPTTTTRPRPTRTTG